MEELQDAIEDAQYVNAISTQEDGPRPVLAWEFPPPEELQVWKDSKSQKNPAAFTCEWTVSSALGLFLFSAFLKEHIKEHVRINFVEEVLRWRRHDPHLGSGKKYEQHKLRHAKLICSNYLEYLPTNETESTARTAAQEEKEDQDGEQNNGAAEDPQQAQNDSTKPPPTLSKIQSTRQLPPKTEIDEYDLERPPSKLTKTELDKLYKDNFDSECKVCPIGLDGPVRYDILRQVQQQQEMRSSRRKLPPPPQDTTEQSPSQKNNNNAAAAPTTKTALFLPDDLFDKAEAIIMESLRRDYWNAFTNDSSHYLKLLNFFWYQDRPVIPKDFFTMRVLGRGGFGLVTACKKGTSGKLYAMKIMSKKRIKMKKAQGLALNERAALAAVQSPFVVNLSYSFHSADDVFLILDLMAGGDLGFHLQQKGRFPKKECIYYAARIMLGLQALHDQGYVYRDLKPENCLLAEDGRVKLTDFGLATKVTPNLHGAAGTRGYWAPEMLRRDARGKRMPYGHTVDWFSFGCCVAEFISGQNPFRSEAALNFGLERKKESKEKAIDCATLEMDPPLDPERFDDAATDFCRRLLDKNETTRLGTNGCEDIMSHPWFKDADWELISSDRKKPPFIPARDINAASQSEIGTFAEDKAYQETVVSDKDEEMYQNWDWTNPKAFSAEVIEFLIYERETGEPLVPQEHNAGCCCVVS